MRLPILSFYSLLLHRLCPYNENRDEVIKYMEFSPRFTQILFLLLHAKEPISSDGLANQLGVSRRTIFRELDHVDRQLKDYGLTLESGARSGYILKGAQQGKDALLQEIEGSDSFDPRNREHRREKLLGMLLLEEENQKLYYYAQQLQVSEGTISNDLDFVENWLSGYQIKVIKRAGYGIRLKYAEADYRMALLAYAMKYDTGAIVKNDSRKTLSILLDTASPMLKRTLTTQAYESLLLYLALMAERIQKGKGVSMPAPPAEAEDSALSALLSSIEHTFQIIIRQEERNFLLIFLRSRQTRYVIGPPDSTWEDADRELVLNLVFEMAKAFDPGHAYDLEQDDKFIEGLYAHLLPTMTRLRHGLKIENPLKEEILSRYKDVYEKSCAAGKILEEKLGCRISEDETAYLALHFGGALARRDYKRRSRRQVRAGIVCASGIGISSLLSARLQAIFGRELQLKVLDSDMAAEEAQTLDFIVTTFALGPMEIPSIQVNQLLTDEDIKTIAAMVEHYAVKEQKQCPPRQNQLRQAIQVTNEISSILNHFNIYKVPAGLDFASLAGLAAEIAGQDAAQREILLHELLEREKLSSQVIPEYGIALLHAKSKAVKNSLYYILLPESGCFTNPYMEHVKAAVVMFINRSDERETLAISAISQALFEDESYLTSITCKDEQSVRRLTERILNSYFHDYFMGVYSEGQETPEI